MGELPALPDLCIDTVSVRDVARAHLLAMTVPEAAGKRFLVTNATFSFKDISRLMVKEFGAKGYSPTRWQAPHFVVHALAFFGDKQAQMISGSLGKRLQFDPVNARTVLKLQFEADPADCVLQMAYGAILSGVMADKSQGQSITKGYVRPELDVSGIATGEELAAAADGKK
jgi:nucleoside-diphosphate-sugar epimerase